MFMLMSRSVHAHANHVFATDFYCESREACEIAMEDSVRAERANGFPPREYIVVEVVARSVRS